jgi:uncharacterized protein YbjT (DUF2867 family)
VSADPKVILVTGATGVQGGAVARELLERGYVVRALTRDADGAAAQALAGMGAQPFEGDFDDSASIAAAMKGAYGVFAVTLFWPYGYAREIEHGKRLIDEAERAGIRHFVLTSAASADDHTGLPHLNSKWEIEQFLHASKLDWTIVRPVEFMDNWLRWSAEQLGKGQLIDPRSPDTRHQWIAASDIGFFVGEAFDHPDDWMGLTKEIAGDEMTVGELRALMSEVFSRPVEYIQIPWEDFEAGAGEEIALMYHWFEDVGFSVDVAALRARYPGLITVRQFLTTRANQFKQHSESD